MCKGGAGDHLRAIVSNFSTVAKMKHLGFEIQHEQVAMDSESGELLECAAQDDLADKYATLMLSYIGLRSKRVQGFEGGWPLRRCLFTDPDPAVRRVAGAEFADCMTRCQKLVVPSKDPLTMELEKGSMWRWEANRQIDEQLKADHGAVSPRIQQFSLQASCKFVTSQINEDAIHRITARCHNAATRDIGDTYAFASVLEGKVLDLIHDYKPIDVHNVRPVRNGTLPPGMFTATETAETWPKLKQIVGPEKPKWHSPGGHNVWDNVSNDRFVYWL